MQPGNAVDYTSINIFIDASNSGNVSISYILRDLDSNSDNATQPVALQFRTSSSNTWTDITEGYVADASVGSAQTSTSVSVSNIAGTAGQATLEFRIITGNAVNSDEWIGVDDIQVTCFFPGTQIATPTGSSAVETLAIGDMVLTTEGTAAPIRWMGRQTVSTIFADPLRVLPIRIAAGALAENVPSRDLLLSPDHAIEVGGILIQAGALVNGTTITRETQVPTTFTYHHVELADHRLILAENTPAETFVDNVDRLAFDNWDEHEALYGHLPGIVEMPTPRAKSHRQVPPAIRARLAERAEAVGGTLVAA